MSSDDPDDPGNLDDLFGEEEPAGGINLTLAEKEAPRLPKWESIGACYDILECDPADLSKGGRGKPAFQLGAAFVLMPDGRFRMPAEVEYVSRQSAETSKDVTQMTSIYDYRSVFKLSSTISVEDATGEQFKASLSNSYEQTLSMVSEQSRIVSAFVAQVNLYTLRVRRGAGTPPLHPELAAALAALPTKPGPEHEAFIRDFGTHFSESVLFGGRMCQRSSVSRSDYERALQQGMTVSAEGMVTARGVRFGASVGSEDTTSTRTKQVASYLREKVLVSGGEGAATGSVESWSMTVNENPAAIEVEFRPLHSLLTKEYFPRDRKVAARQKALASATDDYARRMGRSLGGGPIAVGDRVALALVGTARPRPLAATSGYVSTPALDRDDSDPGDEKTWVVERAEPESGTADGGAVLDRMRIRLRSVTTGSYLDAQAGFDETYGVGDGLAGLGTGDGASGQWRVERVDPGERREVVDGDYVALRSLWLYSAEEEAGHLLGETNAAAEQRVYSFGAKDQAGTVWQIRRIASG